MTLIRARQNVSIVRDITIKDADGDTITPNAPDHIRATIKRVGGVTRLTVADNASTANGSTFTKGSANRLSIAASDLNFPPGLYSLFIDFYDNAGSTWRPVDQEPFLLEPS